jgi:hypothetical protein
LFEYDLIATSRQSFMFIGPKIYFDPCRGINGGMWS